MKPFYRISPVKSGVCENENIFFRFFRAYPEYDRHSGRVSDRLVPVIKLKRTKKYSHTFYPSEKRSFV